MMQLRNVGLVNWWLFGQRDVAIHGHTGILGPNRSGKSTLLDAIQLAIAGNHGRFVRLNSAANRQERGRGRRTVTDYCLGRYGERPQPGSRAVDQVLRTDCLTYIMLGFENAAGRQLTAGVIMEARDQEKEHVISRFIADGILLKSSDAMASDGREMDPNAFRKRAQARAEQSGGTFKEYDKPETFVVQVLRTASPTGRPPDAGQVLRGLSTAVSYENVSSTTEFIRKNFLEKQDIDIERLRTSIMHFQEIYHRIERLRVQCARARSIFEQTTIWIKLLEEQDALAFVKAAADVIRTGNRYLDYKKRLRSASKSLDREERHVTALQQALDTARQDLDIIKDRIRAETPADQISEIRRRQSDIRLEVTEARSELKSWRSVLVRLAGVQKIGAEIAHFDSYFSALERLTAEGLLEGEDATWPQKPDAIVDVMTALQDTKAVMSFVNRLADTLTVEAHGLDQEIKTARRKLENAQRLGAAVNEAPVRLCEALKTQGIDAQILCTVIEGVDDQWRDAAESLLGRDREAILVDPQHAATAVEFLRKNQRDYRYCRVVNTRRLDSDDRRVEDGGLATKIRTDHKYARRFINQRIGNVRCVLSRDDLLSGGRAVMPDVTYNDGLVVEVRRRQDPLLGVNIDEVRATLEARIADTTKRMQISRNAAARLRTAADSLSAFEEKRAASDLTLLAGTVAEADERIADLEEQIGDLEDRVPTDLIEQRAEKMREIMDLEQDMSEARQEIDKARDTKTRMEERLGGGDVGSTLDLKQKWNAYKAKRSQVTFEHGAAAYRDYRKDFQGKEDALKRLSHAADQARSEKSKKMEDLGWDINRLCTRYVQDFTPTDTISASERVTEIHQWFESEIERLEHNELMQYEEKARHAAEETKKFFQESFVDELLGRIRQVGTQIDRLNAILKQHVFHNEIYSIHPVPDHAYSDLIALVEAVGTDPSILEPLFANEIPEDAPYREALIGVRDILLGPDTNFEAYEDYRNYYNFSLRMKDIKTHAVNSFENRAKTGSGAEQQTPFYVIMGAALASAYHGPAATDQDADKGIAVALFDEAFSKLDEMNQRSLANFYRSVGLQPIIAGPWDKRRVYLGMMDSIVEVFRDDKAVDTETVQPGPKLKAALEAEDPGRWSPEKVREAVESDIPDRAAE